MLLEAVFSKELNVSCDEASYEVFGLFIKKYVPTPTAITAIVIINVIIFAFCFFLLIHNIPSVIIIYIYILPHFLLTWKFIYDKMDLTKDLSERRYFMYDHSLKTFIEVADCGSFLKASEKLFISPTAVMKQMTRLEQHIGLPLMIRTNQGIRLTEAGKSLYEDAKKIIRFSEEAIARAYTAQKMAAPLCA